MADSSEPRRRSTHVTGSDEGAFADAQAGFGDDEWIEATELSQRHGGSGAPGDEGEDDDLDMTQLGLRARRVIDEDLESTQLGTRARNTVHVDSDDDDDDDDFESTELSSRARHTLDDDEDDFESTELGSRARGILDDNDNDGEDDDFESTQLGSRARGAIEEDDLESTQLGARRSQVVDDELEETALGSRTSPPATGGEDDEDNADADDNEHTEIGSRARGTETRAIPDDELEPTHFSTHRTGRLAVEDTEDPDLNPLALDDEPSDDELEPTDPGSRRPGERSHAPLDEHTMVGRRRKQRTESDPDATVGSRAGDENTSDTEVSSRRSNGDSTVTKTRRKSRAEREGSRIEDTVNFAARRTIQITDSAQGGARSAYSPKQAILRAPYRPRKQVSQPIVHLSNQTETRPSQPLEQKLQRIAGQRKSSRRRVRAVALAGGSTILLSAGGLIALLLLG